MVEKQEDQVGRKQTEALQNMSLKKPSPGALSFRTLIQRPNSLSARKSQAAGQTS